MPEVPDSAFLLNKFGIHRNDQHKTNGRSKHGGALIAVIASVQHARVTLPCNYTDTDALRVETPDQRLLIVCKYNAPKNSPYRV